MMRWMNSETTTRQTMRNLEASIPMDFAVSSLEARMLSLFAMSMMPINRNSVMKNKLPRHIERGSSRIPGLRKNGVRLHEPCILYVKQRIKARASRFLM